MKHMTPLPAVEPVQQGKTPGCLGTTVRSTPRRRRTLPRNLRSYGSSEQSLMKILVELELILEHDQPFPHGGGARR